MKVKFKFGVMSLGLILAAGSLIGCGDNPAPKPEVKYSINWNVQDTVYEVTDIERGVDKYTKNQEIEFGITLKSTEHYIKSVTSDEVTVAPGATAGKYKFTMPANDVDLLITAPAVDKYEVSIYSGEEVNGGTVEYKLSFGGSNKPVFTIEAAEEDAAVDGHRVTFKKAGEIELTFKEGNGVYLYTANVREPREGETKATAITAARAIEIGMALNPQKPESGSAIYSESTEEYYWVKGVIHSFYKNDAKGAAFYLDKADGFEFYGYDLNGKKPYEVIGGNAYVHCRISKFTPNDGGVWIIENDSQYTDAMEVDFETLTGAQLYLEPKYALSQGTLQLPAFKLPRAATGSLTYEVSPSSCASVSETGLVTFAAAGTVSVKVKAAGKEVSGSFVIVDGKVADRWTTEKDVKSYENLSWPAVPGKGETTSAAEKEYVIGRITKITNTTHGNCMIESVYGEETLEVRGMYTFDGSTKYGSMDAATKPVVGDVVVLYGTAQRYNNAYTYQFADGWMMQKNGEVYKEAELENIAVAPETTSVNVYNGAQTVSFSATPIPTSAKVGTVTWAVEPEGEGVTVNASTGVVTVAQDAVAVGGTKNFIIKATETTISKTASAILTVTRDGKKWYSLDTTPEAGTGYRFVLDREDHATKPGLFYVNGEESATGAYYFATSTNEVDAASVTVLEATGGYKLLVGTSKYIKIIKTTGSDGKEHISNYFDTDIANASVFTFDETLGTYVVTIDEKKYGMGTAADKTYDTVSATDFTTYPNNYKVRLQMYGIPPAGPDLESIVVTPETATIKVGRTVQLSVAPYPKKAELGEVTWTSSNANATVEAKTGLVEGVSEGSAVITCTHVATGKTDTATITIEPASEETSVAKYTFSNEQSTTAVTDSATIVSWFKKVSGESIVTSASAATAVYPGANGGKDATAYTIKDSLKIGKAKEGGTLTLGLSQAVTKIVITGYGWKAELKITINTVENAELGKFIISKDTIGTTGEATFELASSNSITISTNTTAVVITAIEFFA